MSSNTLNRVAKHAVVSTSNMDIVSQVRIIAATLVGRGPFSDRS